MSFTGRRLFDGSLNRSKRNSRSGKERKQTDIEDVLKLIVVVKNL